MVKITANATAVQGFSNVLLSEAAAPLKIDYDRAIQKIKDSKASLQAIKRTTSSICGQLHTSPPEEARKECYRDHPNSKSNI